MIPSVSRRTFLQTGGVAIVAVLAGCEIRRGTESPGHDEPTDERSPDVDAEDEHPAGSPGADGGSTATEPSTLSATVTTGRTYSFRVENRITRQDLEQAGEAEPDMPATITIIVEENWDDGTETTVFKQELAIPPEGSRSITDAFTTKRHGPRYVVRVKMAQFPTQMHVAARNYSDAIRFTPGGFNEPASTTFVVRATDFEAGHLLQPVVGLRVSDGSTAEQFVGRPRG